MLSVEFADEFLITRKPYVFRVDASPDPPKSPSAESADEFLIVRKPYVFTVTASPVFTAEGGLLCVGCEHWAYLSVETYDM